MEMVTWFPLWDPTYFLPFSQICLLVLPLLNLCGHPFHYLTCLFHHNPSLFSVIPLIPLLYLLSHLCLSSLLLLPSIFPNLLSSLSSSLESLCHPTLPIILCLSFLCYLSLCLSPWSSLSLTASPISSLLNIFPSHISWIVAPFYSLTWSHLSISQQSHSSL